MKRSQDKGRLTHLDAFLVPRLGLVLNLFWKPGAVINFPPPYTNSLGAHEQSGVIRVATEIYTATPLSTPQFTLIATDWIACSTTSRGTTGGGGFLSSSGGSSMTGGSNSCCTFFVKVVMVLSLEMNKTISTR